MAMNKWISTTLYLYLNRIAEHSLTTPGIVAVVYAESKFLYKVQILTSSSTGF